MKYEAIHQARWKGRQTKPEDGVQYWYQQVKCVDTNDFFPLEKAIYNKAKQFGIIGYASDEGVKRNKGREGAKQGPKVIREQLAKLAIHDLSRQIYDLGDVLNEATEMEETQEAFSNLVEKSLDNGLMSIGLGGGHDISYAHFKGIDAHFEKINDSPTRIGIINFDTHFDLREVEEQPNSGSPFWQILTNKESKNEVGYLVLGIQQTANTSSLFDLANSYKNVHFKCLDQLNYGHFPVPNAILWELTQFMNTFDKLYVTVDLDGFASAYAPGVSAPSAFGFTPEFVAVLLKHIVKSGKIVAFDIAEMNPNFDTDNRTAKLSAQLVNLVVMSV